VEHLLPFGKAMAQARWLMAELDRKKSIGVLAGGVANDPALSTAPLFGEARGKMFGVLECRSKHGKQHWLYGFSGQYNGRWLVPGWAGPLFDLKRYRTLHDPAERQIKELTSQMEGASEDQKNTLTAERAARSQQLMQKLHALYRLNNFCGSSATLDEVLQTGTNKPTGIGDCCAPKLLNQAAAAALLPVSLAEFYYGRESRSSTRVHRAFYPACTEKCAPLLGYMLCGAQDRK
jgi:hypothetical protein